MFCYAALGQRQVTLRNPPPTRLIDNVTVNPPAEKKEEGSVWPIVAVVGGAALLLWGLS